MPNRSFRLLGRSVLAMAIAPEPPLPNWFRELDELIERSPGFFAGRPIILDASAVDLDQDALRAMVRDLSERGIRLMGFEGVAEAALAPDLPPLISGSRERDVASASKGGEPDRTAEPKGDILVIDRPVRSGQTVTYPHDVTVIGSVSSGAEIVAGGSIHIYGALRGRAIAGTVGNAGARVFCSRLDAELIAIAGLYQTADDMPTELVGRAAQARLEGDAIRIAGLN